MSTSILNIWITNLGDPCSIANNAPVAGYTWEVAVMHCDGKPLNWSETRYRFHKNDPWIQVPLHTIPGSPPLPPGWYSDNIPTQDGHVEIEVPPGCYVLRASLHNWLTNGILFGNWVTDRAVIQACCGEEVCATLYAPTVWACGVPLLEFVFPLLVRHNILPAEALRNLEGFRDILARVAGSSYEQGEVEVLRSRFAQFGSDNKPPNPAGA